METKLTADSIRQRIVLSFCVQDREYVRSQMDLFSDADIIQLDQSLRWDV
jgi:hypothetical protein